jgi:hypothetical protein
MIYDVGDSVDENLKVAIDSFNEAELIRFISLAELFFYAPPPYLSDSDQMNKAL